MHPVAKRCLTWAIILVVLGVIMLTWAADLTYWFQNLVGANAEPAMYVFTFLVNVVDDFALPLAAGLVAAAIVIQVLAPQPRTVNSED